MRPITDVLKDGAWKGRRAFVVGSGPSLRDFDRSVLRDELSIGCNEEYRWSPTIALCQDPRFFVGDGYPGRVAAKDNPQWYAGPCTQPVYFHGHPDSPMPEANDSILLATSAHTRETPFAWGTSLKGGLYYGANVGMSAINLAELLGADPIYLLGFDAKADGDRTHCHDAYPKEWTLDKEVDRRYVYGRWIAEFRNIAPKIKSRVINLNPDSAIDAFPKARLSVHAYRWTHNSNPYSHSVLQMVPVGM